MRCPACNNVGFEIDAHMSNFGKWVERNRGCDCGARWQTRERPIPSTCPPPIKRYAKGYRGPNWPGARQAALYRDDHKCLRCGSTEGLHVHHKIPLAKFGGNFAAAHQLSNLETLCIGCHVIAHRESPEGADENG